MRRARGFQKGELTVSTKTVLVIGVFDLFHRGHVEFLRRARQLGDRLIVVVNGDEFVSRYKRKPVFSEDDRLAIVASLRDVDFAFISNSPDARPVIEEQEIDLIVHGDDWEHASYLKQICVDQAYLDSRRIEMKYVPYYAGVSTSEIIERIRDTSR